MRRLTRIRTNERKIYSECMSISLWIFSQIYMKFDTNSDDYWPKRWLFFLPKEKIPSLSWEVHHHHHHRFCRWWWPSFCLNQVMIGINDRPTRLISIKICRKKTKNIILDFFWQTGRMFKNLLCETKKKIILEKLASYKLDVYMMFSFMNTG